MARAPRSARVGQCGVRAKRIETSAMKSTWQGHEADSQESRDRSRHESESVSLHKLGWGEGMRDRARG